MQTTRRTFIARAAATLTVPLWPRVSVLTFQARDASRIKAHPFDLKQVRLRRGLFLDAAEVNRKYMASLDPNSLLHMFRITAGLPSSAKPLGGWEQPENELRGHFTGHYLSACALMNASLGDESFKARGDHLVVELAKCQKALGNGYLSAFPETFFDRLRAGTNVWAPFYTLHKIMVGLLDMHTYCGNAQALDVLKGMANWTRRWVDPLGEAHMARVLEREYGGMNDVLYNMLKLTRHVFGWTADPRAADYYERALFNGILGTQHPEDGMTLYYVSLASAYWKLFGLPLDAFWCCTGSGVESFAKLGDSIYFHDDDGVYVNLFIASEVEWPEKGLKIIQETTFPETDTTTLSLRCKTPVRMPLRIRVPYWATRGGTVKLNGRELESFAEPSSYCVESHLAGRRQS